MKKLLKEQDELIEKIKTINQSMDRLLEMNRKATEELSLVNIILAEETKQLEG